MVVASAIISGLALGYGVYAGEAQQSAARKGMRLQQTAQREAENSAIREAKIGEEQEKRAKAQSPDLNVLLADQLRPKVSRDSINADRLLLGRPGALGY